MRGLVTLALLALVIATAHASQCSYRSSRSCGFWGWSRCSYTAYRYCVHGGWSAWTEQSRTSCNKECGGGTLTITKRRTCTNPTPYRGNSCSGQSSMQVTASCNTQPCPIDGGWTDWNEWQNSGQCSVTCGGGAQAQTRDRACTNPTPRYGGRACAGESTQSKTIACNPNPCPIDGGWTDWEDWESTTKCTVMCGGGEKDQTRDRSCTNPPPQYGGRACVGENKQNRTIACNTEDCGDKCPVGADTYIAAGDKHYYYHCQQGQNNTVSTKAILMKCPKTTVWSQDSKTCINAPAPAPVPTCTEGQSRADPDDCSFYMQCVGGSETRRPCPGGTKFDNSLGMCNIASLVNC